MSRTLLFDLDGTLVDSVPDLAAALNRLAAARGMRLFDPAEIVPMVGDGVRVLVERAFSARDAAADEAAIAGFAADYGAHAADASRLYPAVPETLARLQAGGWTLAVCTNKPEATARSLLDALGIGGCFAAIGGGDSFPVRKPDPAHLLATLRAAGGDASRAVMVGDHRNDIRAAAGAGVPAIFAAWGYSARDAGEGAAIVAEAFADVPGAAEGLVGAHADAKFASL